MLKKPDLAKQFELVVKQEIKNYQDSLNFVLQSIRELKDSIEEVRNESLENYAAIHSEHNDLAIQLQNLKNAVATLNQSFLSASCDQRTVNEKNASDLKDFSGAFIHFSQATNVPEKIRDLWIGITDLKEGSDKNFRILNDHYDDLLRLFRKEIQKAKQEILEAPSEASLIKQQLEEKISIHNVDVAGIMRELRLYKHDNMVTQKKIENIYMLIERLSKPEVLP